MIPKISLKLNNDVLLTVIDLLEQNQTFLVNNITDALVLSCQEELIVLLHNKAKSVQKQVSILDHNKKHSITLKYHLGYSLLKLLESSIQETEKKDKKINRIITDLGNKVKLNILEKVEYNKTENQAYLPLQPESQANEPAKMDEFLVEGELSQPEISASFTSLTADHFDKLEDNVKPLSFDLFEQQLEQDLFTQEETAVEETAVEETAVEETAVEETAVEETAVEETAVEETAVEETAVEETAVEETAVEETAVEETAVEDFSEFFAVQKQGLPQSFEQVIATKNETTGNSKEKNKPKENKKKQAKDKNPGQISLF
ncbi:hypothetical protein ACYSNX_01370 [Myroides sp. LJL115]